LNSTARAPKVNEIGAIAGLVAPAGIAFGPGGDIFVTSRQPDRVVELDSSGNVVRELGAGAASPIRADRILGRRSFVGFVRATDSVFELDPSGAKIAKSPTRARRPGKQPFRPSGKMFVLSAGARSVSVFSADGTCARTFSDPAWLSPSAMMPGTRRQYLHSRFAAEPDFMSSTRTAKRSARWTERPARSKPRANLRFPPFGSMQEYPEGE